MYYNNYDNSYHNRYNNYNGYNNCVCYPNATPQDYAYTNILAEHVNDITVINDTGKAVRTFFVGLGPHCLLSVAEGVPFICDDVIIPPDTMLTRAVKGWANSVAAIDPDYPKRSCGYKNLFTKKGPQTVYLSSVLKGTNRNCSSLLGVICRLFNTAFKIPTLGGWFKAFINPFLNCADIPPELPPLEFPELPSKQPLQISVENDQSFPVTVTWGSKNCDSKSGCERATISAGQTVRKSVESSGAWVGISMDGDMCKFPVKESMRGVILVSTINNQCKVK